MNDEVKEDVEETREVDREVEEEILKCTDEEVKKDSEVERN
jgi:hypothetical protein